MFRLNAVFCLLLVLLSVMIYPAFARDDVPEPQPCPSAVNVGCYYFPGHFDPARWIPIRDAGFPMPLLGYYRDDRPEILDWHIKWAVEHGIDFFAFDYYYHWENGPNTVHNSALDKAFLKARYRNLINFTFMWCNEEGGEYTYTEEQMLRLARELTEKYFCQDNFLKVDGNNVLIISNPRRILESFGLDGSAAVFEKMSDISRQAGCGGILFIAKQQKKQADLKRAGFGATTAYNYPLAGVSSKIKEGRGFDPYVNMVGAIEEEWIKASKDKILPYMATISPGWDSRPWYKEKALVRTNPRPRLYYEMCQKVKPYIDPNLNMVMIGVWNEFGEGHYMEPTTQFGFSHLDALRDAFCEDNPHHDDKTPAAFGLTSPVFPTIPEPVEVYLKRGENLLFNGTIEEDWGWVFYNDEEAPLASQAHSGHWSLRVPAGDGVKGLWSMPIPASRRVRLHFWYRVPENAGLSIKFPLFKTKYAWLQRYLEVVSLSSTNGQWTAYDRVIEFQDTEATHIKLEMTAAGGDCLIDEIEIMPVKD